MKDSVEGEVVRIDMSVHIHICFAYFDKLVANFATVSSPVASSSGSVGLKHSLHSIYKGKIFSSFCGSFSLLSFILQKQKMFY
jgi:hypothetical protein